MTRIIECKYIEVRKYLNKGIYPCVELDYFMSLRGFHAYQDMVMAGNSICDKLVNSFGGEYDLDTGLGSLNLQGHTFRICADFISAWIDLTCLELSDVDDIIKQEILLKEYLQNNIFEYPDCNANQKVRGIQFNE